MSGEEVNHEAVKQPGLLELTGVARARQDFQFAVGYTLLKGEGALMRVVLASGEDDRRTGDAGWAGTRGS